MKLNAIFNRTFWLLLTWLIVAMPTNAFYDPSLGRWINRDPIEESGGINLHEFANNEPVRHVDSAGRLVFAIPLAIPAVEGLGVFLGGCVVAGAAGTGIGLLVTREGVPTPPPPALYPGVNAGSGVNAAPSSICRPYPPVCPDIPRWRPPPLITCRYTCPDGFEWPIVMPPPCPLFITHRGMTCTLKGLPFLPN
jgi:hypothetical protein